MWKLRPPNLGSWELAWEKKQLHETSHMPKAHCALLSFGVLGLVKSQRGLSRFVGDEDGGRCGWLFLKGGRRRNLLISLVPLTNSAHT